MTFYFSFNVLHMHVCIKIPYLFQVNNGHISKLKVPRGGRIDSICKNNEIPFCLPYKIILNKFSTKYSQNDKDI